MLAFCRQEFRTVTFLLATPCSFFCSCSFQSGLSQSRASVGRASPSQEYSKLKGTNHRLQEGNSCWTKRKSSWVQPATGTGTWGGGCSVSILGDFQNSDRRGSKHPEQSLQLILLRGLEEPGPETTKEVSSDQLLCDSDTSLSNQCSISPFHGYILSTERISHEGVKPSFLV